MNQADRFPLSLVPGIRRRSSPGNERHSDSTSQGSLLRLSRATAMSATAPPDIHPPAPPQPQHHRQGPAQPRCNSRWGVQAAGGGSGCTRVSTLIGCPTHQYTYEGTATTHPLLIRYYPSTDGCGWRLLGLGWVPILTLPPWSMGFGCTLALPAGYGWGGYRGGGGRYGFVVVTWQLSQQRWCAYAVVSWSQRLRGGHGGGHGGGHR